MLSVTAACCSSCASTVAQCDMAIEMLDGPTNTSLTKIAREKPCHVHVSQPVTSQLTAQCCCCTPNLRLLIVSCCSCTDILILPLASLSTAVIVRKHNTPAAAAAQQQEQQHTTSVVESSRLVQMATVPQQRNMALAAQTPKPISTCNAHSHKKRRAPHSSCLH
jgi:hypothetical protein